jgi:hypothetical protein
VEHLPDDIEVLYEEARNCTSVNAFNASAMLCRKILIHLAVEKGAEEGKSFEDYLDYIADRYISDENRQWVQQIRDKGGEARHQMPQMTKYDAEQLITFIEMLLKLIYEFPGKIQGKAS